MTEKSTILKARRARRDAHVTARVRHTDMLGSIRAVHGGVVADSAAVALDVGDLMLRLNDIIRHIMPPNVANGIQAEIADVARSAVIQLLLASSRYEPEDPRLAELANMLERMLLDRANVIGAAYNVLANENKRDPE